MKSPDEPEFLLVEDNPDDAELTLRAFRRRGLTHSFHVVRDGAEAIEYLLGASRGEERRLPRVVFLDLKLPKVSGLEVLARIRANEGLSGLPVVVLTSSSEEADMRDAYRLGANSYIVKPVEFEKFERVVSDVGLYWLQLNQLPV